jgi:membrane protein YqaA with SNARE-associated domain
MTSQLWTLTALSFVSASVPVVNIEAILLTMRVTLDGCPPALMAAVAASAQMIGKFVFFRAGRRSATHPLTYPVRVSRTMLRRKETADQFTKPLPPFANHLRSKAALCFVSAAAGLPPFAVVSFMLGRMRLAQSALVGLGLAGRFARFYLVVTGADLMIFSIADLW